MSTIRDPGLFTSPDFEAAGPDCQTDILCLKRETSFLKLRPVACSQVCSTISRPQSVGPLLECDLDD